MPVFDIRCLGCNQVTEVWKRFDEPYTCPVCGCGETKTLPPAVKGLPVETDPFEQRIGDTNKPIKSFANDKRRGGKDTT